MILIDSHLDIALNALVYNRDLKKTALQIREDEAGYTGKGRARGTIGLPDLRAANVAVHFVTCLARVHPNPPEDFGIDYRTHEAAYAHAQAELAYYHELARQGYRGVDADEIVSAYVVGVRSDYIRAMAAAGYPRIPLEELTQLKAVGVTPGDVERFRRAGFTHLDVDQLVQAKALGLTPEEIRASREDP